jgi:parallel beta-helix repeat protein/predicted outer membrane repeat protein
MFERLWSTRQSRPTRVGPAHSRGRRRPALEPLEDRLVPATLVVDSLADTAHATDSYLSLREAVALVNSPTLPSGLSAQILAQINGTLHAGGTDTIGFDPTTVTGPITLGGTQLELSLPSSTARITIGGATGVTVDGNNASRVFQVDAGVVVALSHLTIQHGRVTGSGIGGGILDNGALTVTDSTISDNAAASGGGIFSTSNSTVTVDHCTLEHDIAQIPFSYGYGGGICADHSSLSVSNGTLAGNSTDGDGGGIDSIFSPVTVSDSALTGNSATGSSSTDGGGGIYVTGGGVMLMVSNSTLMGNSALGSGGGIYTTAGSVTVSNSTLASNSSSQGGGGIFISTFSDSVTLSNCTLAGNSSHFYGGGIYAASSLTTTVSNCTLTGNSAFEGGGGIYVFRSVTVTNSTLTGNSAGFGGGIYDFGTVTVGNSSLEDNSALGDGGGIDASTGTVTVNNSTLIGNSAHGHGGGIDASSGSVPANVMVSNSTLTGNSAQSAGGGIFVDFSNLRVNNSTLADNSAPAGGGIYGSSNAGRVAMSSSTLTGNSANSGGGIRVDAGGTLSLQNTIVAGNGSAATSGPDIRAAVVSASSYNLVGQADSTLTGISDGVNHNQVGTSTTPIDPLLAPLGFYGGPTPTMPLLPGSPARNSGDPGTTLTTDQRGLPRVVGGSSDIGAFQTQADPFLVTTLLDPGQQFGQLALREAVNLADVLPSDNTVSFDPALGYGTIILTAGQLELSGAPGLRTIDGGNRITVDANHGSRLFLVDAGARGVLTGLSLGNGSSDAGGAVFNSGTLEVANSTLFGNAAILGGAVYNEGSLTVAGSTLEFDFASYQGGGLYNSGQLTAFNSTFVYDTAFHDGGAVYQGAGTATLTSLTISRNNSGSGGGLAIAAGTVLLRNSIVAGNQNDLGSSASDVAGTLSASSSYNLIGTGGSGGLTNGVNHNLVGVSDPGLTTPDFSGSQTPTFGLTANSPARGAGDPTLLSDPLLSLDQHGNVRTVVNIGAI